ncbi:MAG: hypothetical protein FJ015_04335 [Chloroflexi bacterium]|nr:hypothetical protein [Chloroflexota bacterium]
MTDWQVTATTIYCEDIDDEVTVIVQRDGAVRCTGFDRCRNAGRDTAALLKQKSRRLGRQLQCTGLECPCVVQYRERLFAEEAKTAKKADF